MAQSERIEKQIRADRSIQTYGTAGPKPSPYRKAVRDAACFFSDHHKEINSGGVSVVIDGVTCKTRGTPYVHDGRAAAIFVQEFDQPFMLEQLVLARS